LQVYIPGISKRGAERAREVKLHEQLSDPAFVASVIKLMADPRVVETFSIFDQDNSGSITTDELREVSPISTLAPDADPDADPEPDPDPDPDPNPHLDPNPDPNPGPNPNPHQVITMLQLASNKTDLERMLILTLALTPTLTR